MIDSCEPPGPAVRVFVGNIVDGLSDHILLRLLRCCGEVTSWRRATGGDNFPQSFAHCEFSGAFGAARAIRLLHGTEICDKKLIIKVDATQANLLDKFKGDKPHVEESAAGNNGQVPINASPSHHATQDTTSNERTDEQTLAAISEILDKYWNQIKSSMVYINQFRKKTADKQNNISEKSPVFKNDVELSEIPIPEEKKQFVSQEIERFRQTFLSTADTRNDTNEQKKTVRKRVTDYKSHTERKRDAHELDSSPRNGRQSEKNSEQLNADRTRCLSEEGSDETKPQTKPHDKSECAKGNNTRHYFDPDSSKKFKIREEEQQRKIIQENIARQKEQKYQQRLLAWQEREQRKLEELADRKRKEALEKCQQTLLVEKMKRFFEEYNDYCDDKRYYRKAEMAQRKKLRAEEKERDDKDRSQEQDENLNKKQSYLRTKYKP